MNKYREMLLYPILEQRKLEEQKQKRDTITAVVIFGIVFVYVIANTWIKS